MISKRNLKRSCSLGGRVTSMVMVQIFVNVFLALGLGFLFIRILRPQKDDPRLSRGLQLLQNKIAILEDLSDRTDHQFKQMGLLLDEKAKDVQTQISAAQDQIQLLQQSMRKSQDVAKIFQDKIPHEEIIERQNTIKYVRAAQMANQGHSVEDIEKAVGLPHSEVEFIAKVNRDRLMFSVEQLPDWIKSELDPHTSPVVQKAYREAFEPLPDSSQTLAKIGDQFRRAVQEMAIEEAPENSQEESLPPLPKLSDLVARVTEKTLPPQVALSPALNPPAPSAVTASAPVLPQVTTTAAAKRGIISAEAGLGLQRYEFPKVRSDKRV